jgi:lambda family phage portal protein
MWQGAGMIDNIGRAIDRLVGIVSPSAEISRTAARLKALKVRQYAAAKNSRLSGDWMPANLDVNSLIRSSSPVIRDRSRQLVRDFAYFARAVKVLVDFTVGTGIPFQSRVTRGTGEGGKRRLHTTAIRQIEYAWQRWMDEADASGKLHYHEIERLWKRQDVEVGEAIIVKSFDNLPGRFIPLTLQMYEPDWLSSDYAKSSGNNILDQGVEFDPRTGRVVAYHFAVPDGFNGLSGKIRSQRVNAENVIHGFEMLRPGQLRGISPFTTAILLADDLHEYLGAEIDGAKMAAKYLAFVETDDPGAMQMGRVEDDEDGRKLETVENAVIEYLRKGEKINLTSHNRPGDSFGPFTKLVLQMVAVATGVTYELLSGDYSGLNYNALRGVRNDFAKVIQPMQNRHIRQFSRPVFSAFIEAAWLSGKLNMPGFAADSRPWMEGTWQAPVQAPVDMLKEGKAHVEQMKALLRSPQEIVTSSTGRDLEEVYQEIAEAKRMAQELGIEMEEVSTASQTNPAALEEQEDDE